MADMKIEFDVAAKMRDGTVLNADVYRPGGDGPWPVLLQRTPYGRRLGMQVTLDPFEAVSRGYIVVHQDTRGRFGSDGEWLPFTYEIEDGYDTVRWAATLPGSSGVVGMFGSSYMATPNGPPQPRNCGRSSRRSPGAIPATACTSAAARSSSGSTAGGP